MDDGVYARTAPQSFQQSLRTQNVRVQGLQGRRKTAQRIALRSKMKNIIRPGFPNSIYQGDIITQVTINEIKTIIAICLIHKMLYIVQGTAPTAHAVNLPVGIFQ